METGQTADIGTNGPRYLYYIRHLSLTPHQASSMVFGLNCTFMIGVQYILICVSQSKFIRNGRRFLGKSIVWFSSARPVLR